jgi:putative ABC transport system permease protein
MQALWQDLHYGARLLVKQPGFTAIAVVTLALGIGANTAIFSVVNGVLLRPLPFAEPGRLVWMWGTIRGGGSRASVAPLDFLDYRAQNSTFEQFAAAFSPAPLNLTGGGEPERLTGALVTGDYFQTLGVKAALGQTLLPENEQAGRDQVVVLSHGLWQRRFGGDPKVIGNSLTLSGKSYSVVGVMPPGFSFPATTEVWLPLNFAASAELRQRKAHFLRPVGRLKAGVTIEQAQADIDAIARRLEAQYPDSNTGWGLRLTPLRDEIVGDIRPTLLVLFAAVGCVLLIACANVANLLLVRAAARQKEIAVRAALGAGRGRIVRQALTESLLLALLGAGAGLLLAWWGVDFLVRLGADNLPPTARVSLDLSVLAFTLGLAVLTGVLFGLAPALQALKVNLNETLKEGGRSTGGLHRNRTRHALVVVQVAAAVVLLIGAGLLLRSFARLQQVDPGFDAHGVLTMRIVLPHQQYDTPAKSAAFFARLESELAALPGVEAVGLVSELPLSGQRNDAPFSVVGRPPVREDQRLGADFRSVNQHYFAALRVPLLRGRNFTAQEVSQSAPVVIVSERLVRAAFPNEDPVGRRVALGFDDVPREIVGVVGDLNHRGLDAPQAATIYLPRLSVGRTNLVIRAASDPAAVAAAVRQRVRALDPNLPLGGVRPMAEFVGESVAAPRYRTLLVGLFAGVALLLAGVGIYGVMSYAVAQRTHEVGVRMALGAQIGDVMRLVIGQGVKLAFAGVAVGLVTAVALTRLMRALLFGVGATDPLTFVAVALLLAFVALLACYVPARRAARVDPMVALRYE